MHFKPELDRDMTQCHPISDCFLIRQCCLYFCFRQRVLHMSQWNTTQRLSFSMSCLISQHLTWDTRTSFLPSCFWINILHFHSPLCGCAKLYWDMTSCFRVLSIRQDICYVFRPYFMKTVNRDKILSQFFLWVLPEWAAFHIFHSDWEHNLTQPPAAFPFFPFRCLIRIGIGIGTRPWCHLSSECVLIRMDFSIWNRAINQNTFAQTPSPLSKMSWLSVSVCVCMHECACAWVCLWVCVCVCVCFSLNQTL